MKKLLRFVVSVFSQALFCDSLAKDDRRFVSLSVCQVSAGEGCQGLKHFPNEFHQPGTAAGFMCSAQIGVRNKRDSARQAVQRYRDKLKQNPLLWRKYRERQTEYNKKYRAKQKEILGISYDGD